MQKEEFPTFLNEQATVIFGRTTRELLWIVIGAVAGYQVWGMIHSVLPGGLGMALGITLGIVIALIAFVIALLPVGGRSLEEWIAVWIMYVIMPKIYLYKPAEEEVEYESQREREQADQLQTHKTAVDLDILED
jgi:hypothetical protein